MSLARPLMRTVVGLVGATVLLAACASTPSPTPTPRPTPSPSATPSPVASAQPSATPSPVASAQPSVTPSPSATPSPSVAAPPSVVLSPDPFADIPPLPADLRLPAGEFTVRPESVRGMAMNTIVPYDLGHCGLYSPVDLDGSLWEPVAGTDGAGGPIDQDAEVGQLINGTPGQAILVTPERLDWRSTQGTPVVVVFRRIPGDRGYPGCM